MAEDLAADLRDAARFGEMEEVERILALGVDVDAADEVGKTAAHMAAANGHDAVLRALAPAGARHLPNTSGNTPLHWAVSNGHESTVQCILELWRGEVNVLAANDFGRTPISDAFGRDSAATRNPQILRALLAHPSARP